MECHGKIIRQFQEKKSNISGTKIDISSYDLHSNSQRNVKTVKSQQLTQGQNPEEIFISALSRSVSN